MLFYKIVGSTNINSRKLYYGNQYIWLSVFLIFHYTVPYLKCIVYFISGYFPWKNIIITTGTIHMVQIGCVPGVT